MMRYLRYAYLTITALLLLFLALANRQVVEFRVLPTEIAGILGIGSGFSLPLFVIILMAVAVGVLIGFVWEWFREMRLRNAAKSQGRQVARLERELEVLRDAHSIPPRDEVLAILDEGARK